MTNRWWLSLAVGLAAGCGQSGQVSSLSGQVAPVPTVAQGLYPRQAVLTFQQTQLFRSLADTPIDWFVDGVAGGDASTTGTISPDGFYRPPSRIGTHTIAANFASGQSASATVVVSNFSGTFTYHNDVARTAQNLHEVALSPETVRPNHFGKLASYPIDGQAYAEPLYVANLSMGSGVFRNVVYVATQHDSVYAFDADGDGSTPLWRKSFINAAAGITTVPFEEIASDDIVPELGITSTPVIDPNTQTLYVVANTKESGQNVHKLHALDLVSGAEKFGGPVVLSASVPGTGDGSQGGMLPFRDDRQLQRSALLLSQNTIYIAFASHSDNPPYHGWVLAYDATTLRQRAAFSATPNGEGGGIWMSGSGPAADANGDIYVICGDGTARPQTQDFGDSFLRLSADLKVLDFFVPYNQKDLDVFNIDLGSGGPLLLPDQPVGPPHLLLSAGKESRIYLLNRDNLGGSQVGTDSGAVQTLAGQIGRFLAGPVYWNNRLYFAAQRDVMKCFSFLNGRLSSTPVSQGSTQFGYPSSTPCVSADGAKNAIVWTLDVSAYASSGPAVLYAYDALDVSRQLYSSKLVPSDQAGPAVKFTVPTVANGKVFVGTATTLEVYGLLP